MLNFKSVNNAIGWVIFLIATAVYTLTMEATASFWDCGEFILGAYKLEVVHPPGAPLFLMLGRLFTLFAGDNLQVVPLTINFMSAVSTGFAVLFIFWIITDLVRKFLTGGENRFDLSPAQLTITMGAGIIGALSCTFLDTLWFSAVEGEVYALSTFFIPLVFWAILKWHNADNDPLADRWLVFIAYMLGVSIGVHLMSLLAIPAIALVYYLKKYPNPNYKGAFLSLFAGFVVLSLIYIGVVSSMTGIASRFELFFVNSLGMPFWSGAAFFFLLLTGALVYGLFFSHKRQKHHLQVGLLSLAFILIGFSTYFMVVIRSNANPPINMNNPSHIFNLLSYLNREQYGERPLLYGPQFHAYPIDIVKKGKKYAKGEDRYVEVGDKVSYKFDPKEEMLFPRMASWQDDRHARAYRSIVGLKPDEKPTFGDNLKFFFNYQIGFMYFRYFMWNFSGRQNDNQGRKDLNNNEGGWITGFDFIDKGLIGPIDNMPFDWERNKARNKFFLLPLLLGLLGMFFHFYNRFWDASVIMVLFLFTGLMEIVYFNSPPFEPRERDYTLVGSFVTFTIWMGFGVVALYEWGKQYLKGLPGAIAVSALCLPIPIILGAEGWDDHDRSKRYTARDYAINYLESCAPNAIIFTQGDNDTYPLWYAQEVENVRPDVRVVNLSLLGVDWYIDKLHYKANEAPPVKLTLKSEQYAGNNRDMVRYFDSKKLDQNKHYELSQIINFMASEDRSSKVQLQSGEFINYLPAKKLKIDINPDQVIAAGVVQEADRDRIVESINWEIGKNTLLKNDLLTLDIIASNLWERPIYFAVSVSPDAYLGLQDYFRLEGLSYRIVPVRNSGAGGFTGEVFSEAMYDNVMNKFKWGGVEVKKEIEYTVQEGDSLYGIAHKNWVLAPDILKWNNLSGEPKPGDRLKLIVPTDIYLDENIQRMTMNLRSNFGRLAEALAAEGKNEKALEVLNRCMEVMPERTIPFNIFMLKIPEIYYKAGDKERAAYLVWRLADVYEQELRYYIPQYQRYERSSQQAIAVLQELMRITSLYNDTKTRNMVSAKLTALQGMLN